MHVKKRTDEFCHVNNDEAASQGSMTHLFNKLKNAAREKERSMYVFFLFRRLNFILFFRRAGEEDRKKYSRDN